MKPPFCETTWAKVNVGDIVLLPWPYDKIIKAEIKTCDRTTDDDSRPTTIVEFTHAGVQCRTTAASDETVYVQSRL